MFALVDTVFNQFIVLILNHLHDMLGGQDVGAQSIITRLCRSHKAVVITILRQTVIEAVALQSSCVVGLVTFGVQTPNGIQVPRQVHIGTRLLVTGHKQVASHVVHGHQTVDKQIVIDGIVLVELSGILRIEHIVGGIDHEVGEAIEMVPVDGGVALVGIDPFVVVPSVHGIVVCGQGVKRRSARAIAFVQHSPDVAIVFAQTQLLAVHALGQGIDALVFLIDKHIGIDHADARHSIWLTLSIRQLVHLHP